MSISPCPGSLVKLGFSSSEPVRFFWKAHGGPRLLAALEWLREEFDRAGPAAFANVSKGLGAIGLESGQAAFEAAEVASAAHAFWTGLGMEMKESGANAGPLRF